MKNVKEIHVSECCGAETTRCDTKIVDNGRGSTRYYRDTCNKCGSHCHTTLGSLWDSYGNRVLPGDILEVLDEPGNDPWRYHAVFRSPDNRAIGLEIRDLNTNDVFMWHPPIKNAGPYWENLSVLSDNDLAYYYGVNREEAEEMAKRYARREGTKE
jgi:hypothetical protein